MLLTPPPSSRRSRQTSSSSATRRRTVSPLPGSSNTSRRVKGGYTPGIFQCVKSIEGFATVLHIPVETIPLITTKNNTMITVRPSPPILANTTNTSNVIEYSLPELRRKVKMWKARSLFLDRHLKKVQAWHIHHLSGIRKKNTMS